MTSFGENRYETLQGAEAAIAAHLSVFSSPIVVLLYSLPSPDSGIQWGRSSPECRSPRPNTPRSVPVPRRSLAASLLFEETSQASGTAHRPSRTRLVLADSQRFNSILHQ
jgi:hypothetical protein